MRIVWERNGIDNKQHEQLHVAVPSGLKPRYDVYPLTPALRLGLVTVIYLNWALALTVPDLQSIGQQTCSDYLLSIPNRTIQKHNGDIVLAHQTLEFLLD